jgi:hypothetical protein
MPIKSMTGRTLGTICSCFRNYRTSTVEEKQALRTSPLRRHLYWLGLISFREYEVSGTAFMMLNQRPETGGSSTTCFTQKVIDANDDGLLDSGEVVVRAKRIGADP